MVTFCTTDFILYTFAIILIGVIFALLVNALILGIKERKKEKTSVELGMDLRVGGVYACIDDKSRDEANPFNHKPTYMYALLVLDKMLSPVNNKMYYQYVFIEKKTMQPYKHYSKDMVKSGQLRNTFFQSNHYIKDINLNTINFEEE
jgi:Mg2+/citrate symporter